MTDIFEHYGLSHLSASQINLYTSEPALWVLRYLFGHKDPLSPAAARGISTEKGIEHGLCNPDAPLQECIDLALQDYDRSLTLIVDDKKEKERDGIPGIVEVGLEELRKYGIPTLPEDDHRQQRIEVEIPGVSVPAIGYLDFDFQDHGIIVDLNTQLRLASKISPSHARQGAIYSQSRGNNVDMRFAYVTPKKQAVFSMETDQVQQSWNEVVNIAGRIQRFLSLSKDRDELARLVWPNYDSFYWNNPITRGAGRDLFGF